MAIRIPVDDIVQKIHEKAELPMDEIKRRIKEKVDELSEYITEEGAAHIIANELGVKLFEALSGKSKVDKLIAGMRNIELEVKVQQKYDVKEFKTKDGREGKLLSIYIADETGAVRCTLWGAQADAGASLSVGDTIRIKGAYTRLNNLTKRVEVQLDDAAEIEVNPEGLKVDAQEREARPSAKRKTIAELSESDDNVELVGFIVSAYEPRFYEVDPKSGRRVRQRGDKFYNDDGEAVEPAYSCVMNAVIDDGTENIRMVCFKNQMLNLCEIGEADLQELRENPFQFEQIRHVILGKPVRVVGRVSKNAMFDRMEFVSQLVFTADPATELKRLEQQQTN